MIEDLDHRIRERAYSLWEREGRPFGREQAHWGMAVAEASAVEAPPATPAARRKVAAAATPAAPKRRAAVARTTEQR